MRKADVNFSKITIMVGIGFFLDGILGMRVRVR